VPLLREKLLSPACLIVVALLCGCATSGAEQDLDEIPAAQRAAVDALREVGDKELALQPYDALGKVEGVSCRRTYRGMPSTWEATVRRTKYEALKKGANAISNLACGNPEGRSYIKLCLDSIRCTADAIRFRN